MLRRLNEKQNGGPCSKFVVVAALACVYHALMAALVLKEKQMSDRPYVKMVGHFAVPKPYLAGLCAVLLIGAASSDAVGVALGRCSALCRTASLVAVTSLAFFLVMGGLVLKDEQMNPRPWPRISGKHAY